MSEYPASLESDVVLKDGSTIRLRPIREEDSGALQEYYSKLSQESLFFRFFTIPKSPDAKMLEYLSHVDYENHFALVAEAGGEMVGGARFIRDAERKDRAEVAFSILDDLQGHGLGTRLLERLADIAVTKGIRYFDADTLPENVKMRKVFRSSGLDVAERMVSGVCRTSLSLERTPRYEERAAERSQKAASASLRPFFQPESVIVVGASRQPGTIGAMLLGNLKSFKGRLHVVHPTASEVNGVPAVPRVTDVPGDVDLAVLVAPAAAIDGIVDDCIAKGVRAVIVITAGFAETGPEGRVHEAAIVEKIRAAGIRMIGPNCMGLLSTEPSVQLNATFVPVSPPLGRIAMSSQSGALGYAILDQASKLGLGFSSFVSVGNKADVSGNDLIQYWAEDDRTDVILLYLESFGNPRRFGELARRVARTKPIVAVKAGRTAAGARAASSHTGSLAASDRATEALFRQAGIIRTDTLEELFDVASFLAHEPLPAGRRVAILTNAGGPGILATDACTAHGLEVPELSPPTVTALRKLLPAAASCGNPVDMIASATADQYRHALELLLADERVDAAIVLFIPPLPTGADEVAEAIVAGAREARGKPVLTTFISSKGVPAALSALPCYPFPERGVAALGKIATYAEWRRKTPGEIVPFPDIKETEIRWIVDKAITRGGGWLTPIEAQDLLRGAGIAAAEARLVHSLRSAARAAQEIGLPVVMKAVGPKILHKSDVGGVRLGLESGTAVREAFAEMKNRLGEGLQAALVQEMVTEGAEVMIGAVWDPLFGPLVGYGSGGTLVELWGDITFRIHPLTDRDAAEMLEEVKGTRLLRGFRGAPRADEAALKETLLRLSALLSIAPEVAEVDLNPVKVLEKGTCVVDARVRVERRPPGPPSRRILY